MESGQPEVLSSTMAIIGVKVIETIDIEMYLGDDIKYVYVCNMIKW